MPISVDCPACGATFRVRDRYAGETVPCKECRKPVPVPAADGHDDPWQSSKPVPLDEPADLVDFIEDEPTPPRRNQSASRPPSRPQSGSPFSSSPARRTTGPQSSRPGVRKPSAFGDDFDDLEERPGRSKRREPVQESSSVMGWILVIGGVLSALGVLIGGLWYQTHKSEDEREQRRQQELVAERMDAFRQPILPPVEAQPNQLPAAGDEEIPLPVPFGQRQPQQPNGGLAPGGGDVVPGNQNNPLPPGGGNFPNPRFPQIPNIPRPQRIPPRIPQPEPEPERVAVWKFELDPREAKIDNAKLKQLGLPGGNLNGVLFAGAPSEFAVMGNLAFGGELKLINLNTGQTVGELPEKLGSSSPYTLDPDGVYLVGRSKEAAGATALDVWSFKTGKKEQTLEISPDRVMLDQVEFAGPKRLVVSYRDFVDGNKQLVKVYDLGAGDKTLKFALDNGDFLKGAGLDVSPGGNYLAVLGARLMIHRLADGEVVADLPIPDQSNRNSWSPEAISFSPDSRQLAVIMARAFHTRIICWDLEQGKILHDNSDKVFHHNHFYFWSGFQGRKIQFLKDKQHLLILGNYVVHAPTGKKIYTFSENHELLMDKARQVFGTDYLVHTWRQGASVSVIATPIPYAEIDKAKPGG